MNRRDDDSAEVPPVPWHNRTSTLLGASVAAVAGIAVLIWVISVVARQFSEPEPAPLYYIPQSSSQTSARDSATPTTTGTITSTSPPMTSDINPDTTPPTTTESETTRRPTTRAPRTREDDEGDGDDETTTRSRPRTNVTRTLYPGT